MDLVTEARAQRPKSRTEVSFATLDMTADERPGTPLLLFRIRTNGPADRRIMEDNPVATLRPSGSTIAIYYVHTDHLGNPRKVTRPSDNGLMWRWDPDTFGSAGPNVNPSGFGTFNYNLRFPGQYALTESALNYNYFRDYDPTMGRYIESDPIGLRGGSTHMCSGSRLKPAGLAFNAVSSQDYLPPADRVGSIYLPASLHSAAPARIPSWPAHVTCNCPVWSPGVSD